MRRICLFAGYDKNNKIQNYVVYMIKKLAQISDVYYMANGKISPEELIKIAPYTQMFYTAVHQQKDFGSWQYIISKLGWEKICAYDQLILCNDSVYGPLYDLEVIFKQMARRGYDFWSMTADYGYNFHLHRYFMVFNKEVMRNGNFQQFWQAVPFTQNPKISELELTPLLLKQGFAGNSYIRNYKQKDVLQMPQNMLNNVEIPFVKIKSFTAQNKYTAGSGLGLKLKIRSHTDYDTALINQHLRQGILPQSWTQKLVCLSGI